MALLARMRSWWRSVFHRSAMERNMSEELQFHLACRAHDLVERRGLTPDEAMRVARLEFGSIEKYKEEGRASLGLELLDQLHGDVRYALRMLGRNKVFGAAAVITLALGIGANTAIFSLIDAVMLRLLPIDKPEQLVTVLLQEPKGKAGDGFTNALWEAIRDQQDVFSGVFAWSTPKPFELGRGGIVQAVRGLMVSGNYFATLGVAPAAGRLIAEADDRRGCPAVAVLSHSFWQTHFAGASGALGSSISLNRQIFQVVGVSAPRFFGVEVGKTFDVAIPLCASALFDRRNLDSRFRWWLRIMGRPRLGLTSDQLAHRLELLSPSIMSAALPGGDAARRERFLRTIVVATPASRGPSELRRVFGEPLMMLMAMVAFVLLIACANIAGLMLARASTRAKEIAIRNALGASRGRLIRQMLTESIVVSVVGAGLGLLFARWSAALLVRELATARNPIFIDLSLDWRVLGFTAAAAIVTGSVIGLMPAVRSTRMSLIAAIKSSPSAGSERRARLRAGRWIVAGQIALSLVLVIGGGLLLRTFITLLTLDMGFDRSNVLVVIAKAPWFAADIVKMPPEQRSAANDEVVARVRALPGVLSVARAFTTPIGDDNWFTNISVDTPGAPSGDQASVSFNFVTPGYFSTLRTPLVAGRDFDARDTKQSVPVAIVNETLARRFFSDANGIGKRFRKPDRPIPIEIVGIVQDSKYQFVREPIPPTAFLPASQAPRGGEAEEFVVRTSIVSSGLIPEIQRIAAQVNPDLPLEFHTLAEQVDDDLVQERLLGTLAGFFGVLALALAMIGLYGVLSYLVTHRQIEFGIRMALGATRASILRLVMRDVLLVLATGVAVGLAAARLSVTLLQKMLFGLQPDDAATTAISVALLSMMALAAGYLPARRATRVDPMIALRSE